MRAAALVWGRVILGLVLIAIGLFGTPRHADSADGTHWEPIGGVIANRGDGWHIHTQGHSHANLISVRCMGSYLAVKHTRGVKVPMWGGPDVDEHLRRWDITAGVSATADTARIFFDIDGRPISCWHKAFREPNSNIWLDGDIEVRDD